MKKHKLPDNARGLLPTVFFFAAADIILFLLQYGKNMNEMTQIGTFSRYLGELCLVIFIFMLITDALKNGKAEPRKKEKKKRRRHVLKKRNGKIGAPDTVQSVSGTPADNATEVEFTDAETNTAEQPDGALTLAAADGKSTEKAAAEITDGESPDGGHKKHRTVNKEKLVKLLFIICFAQLPVRMCMTAIRYSADKLFQNSAEYTVADAAVLGIFAAAAFFFKSRYATRNARGNITYSSLFASGGTAYVIYASVFAVSAVLKLNLYPYLAWVYRILLIYVAVMLAAGLLMSVIRHETAEDMNFPIFIPYINKTEGETFTDTLEKYTGLSLKSLWSIKLTGAVLPAAVLFLGLILFVSTCVYKVEPYEEAVVYRFGALSEMSVTEGLHFKLPYPIDKAELYEVHRVQSVTVGYEATGADDNLWNGTHASEEYTLLTGNGNELVSANLKLNYRITDLTKYIKTSSEPERILTAYAYETVLSHTAFTDLDTLMSVDRTGLSTTLKNEINVMLKKTDIGIEVDEVILESIHPPVDIADVYQSVVSASVKKTTLITNAEREAANNITNAEKTAQTSVNDAKARQTKKVSEAQYDAAVFDAADEAYRLHPESFKLSNYLDTFVTAVKGKKMYVFTPSAESSMNDFIINRTDGNVTVVE